MSNTQGGDGAARDVPEESAAAQALRESEERFRQLAENIREVFWMTDVGKTEMLYVSPGYETVWGRSRESLLAAPHSWLDAVHPEDRERVEAELPDQRERNCETTYRIVRPDGDERWIRDRSFLVREADGAVGRIVGLAEDVTQLVQTEERLRRSEQQLRQAQKLEALGSFAVGMAHDLNNLLTVVLSYTILAIDELRPKDPIRADLEEVRRASTRAGDLTQHLLAFGRKQIMDPSVVDPGKVVEDVSRMLMRLVGEDVAVSVVRATDTGMAYVDVGQLEQVIVNLAINARDAMPRGGNLTIETANVDFVDGYVEQGVAPGRYVMLAVSDTGTGMDGATKARIFEPFFTTKEPGKGTGLGLATVYGIVRQSGGYVWVYSEPNKGTTFKVFLPRTDRAPRAATSTAVRDAASRGTETVLLVEDEESVRGSLRSVLRKNGYKVLDAQNGGEAFLICERFGSPIDLLVTDVVMPRMSGPELAARLSALRPEMKVLYVSGYTENTVAERGGPGTEAAFLQKPITPSALLRKVRQVLDGRGGRERE